MDTGKFDLTPAETLEVFMVDSRLFTNLTIDELDELLQEKIDKVLKKRLIGNANVADKGLLKVASERT